MKREALDYLKDWVQRATRKPLGVRGARQVGKSDLVRMLAAETFDELLEINLETDAEVASLFASKDPRLILELLEARYGTEIRPGKTLLFLDEIHRLGRALEEILYQSSQSLGRLMPASGTTPSAHAAGREASALIADALSRLPSDQEEVIRLRSIQELAWDVVAQRMVRSNNAVRQLWVRAIKKLRPLVEKLR